MSEPVYKGDELIRRLSNCMDPKWRNTCQSAAQAIESTQGALDAYSRKLQVVEAEIARLRAEVAYYRPLAIREAKEYWDRYLETDDE